ncbi:MAG: type I restriction endonuclease [Methanothrix sp.]
MDFIDSMRDLALRIPKQCTGIQTEEATKTAFIMPFIAALGYNVFDPTEVTPELVADVGTKKGEKVDYAILINGKPMILFECKWCGSDLDQEHTSQLYRYFSVTAARFGVLTNGIVYRFYSDLEDKNKMDAKPFLELDLLNLKEPVVEEVKKFSKSSFELDSILATASDLKYMREIKRILDEQLNNPTEDFVKFFASQVYSGKLTQQVREQFAQITKKTFKQFINDKVNDRLNIALASEASASKEEPKVVSTQEATDTGEKAGKTVTTEEELDGYYIIKTLLRESIDANRISIRDALSYCSVLLDDNSRKPIARMYFNSSNKQLGLFDDQNREEQRISIETPDDIYKYADKLIAIVQYYEAQKPQASKPLTSFTFKGERHETKYWKDMLLKISSIMAELHKDRFDDILTISGRVRPFFTRNPTELRSPGLIEGTDIYAETNLSAGSIQKLSKTVISKFGYSESDLSIESE